VAVNAQLPEDGSWGGVQQATEALVHHLSHQLPEDLEVVILRGRGQPPLPGLGPRAASASCPAAVGPVTGAGALPSLRTRGRLWMARLAAAGRGPWSPNEWLAGLGCAAVHFPYQDWFPVALPSLYSPWDLQHRHLPELFAPAERERRDRRYGEGSRRARRVVVATEWTRQDVIRELGLPAAAVRVVPPPLPERPPVSAAVAERVRARPDLQAPFALFPAQPFPHKNHAALLEALSVLRAQGRADVRCVFTGKRGPDQDALRRQAAERGVAEQVVFTGYLPAEDLRALYGACRLVIFPSRFEGLGLPLLEAFAESAPVVSSSAACLPEVGGDAALYFDPADLRGLIQALLRVWDTPALRDELVERGRRRVLRYEPLRIVQAHAALYREAAGRPVPAAEAAALASFAPAAAADA
jgi:glycosyltransferase involved in cell wall biosynthesis